MIFPKAVIPYDNYVVRYETIVGRLRKAMGLKGTVENRGYTGVTLILTQAISALWLDYLLLVFLPSLSISGIF
jgi:hypothetical protein